MNNHTINLITQIEIKPVEEGDKPKTKTQKQEKEAKQQ